MRQIYLWNSINEKRGYGWDDNPWVWVVEFQRQGITPLAVDYGKPGSEKTVVAIFEDGELVDEREIPPVTNARRQAFRERSKGEYV